MLVFSCVTVHSLDVFIYIYAKFPLLLLLLLLLLCHGIVMLLMCSCVTVQSSREHLHVSTVIFVFFIESSSNSVHTSVMVPSFSFVHWVTLSVCMLVRYLRHSLVVLSSVLLRHYTVVLLECHSECSCVMVPSSVLYSESPCQCACSDLASRHIILLSVVKRHGIVILLSVLMRHVTA